MYATLLLFINSSKFRIINKSYCCFVIHKLIRETFIPTLKKNSYRNFLAHSGFVTAGCCFSKATGDYESPLLTARSEKYSEHLASMDKSISEENVNNVDSIGPKLSFSDEGNIGNSADYECINKRCKTSDLTCEQIKTPIPQILQNLNKRDEKCEALKSKDSAPGKRKMSQKKRQTKQRPNYFVAIRISNAEIHNALKEVQDHILEQDQQLKPIMIGLTTLHITLMVMYIGDQDTHQRALRALELVKNEYDDKICQEPLKLEIKGLGNFRNRVLFAKITNDKAHSRLCDLAASVNQQFEAVFVPSTDLGRKFNPHLTIAKINFDRECRFIKKIRPSLYSSYDDQYFGHQTVTSIQLLSMMKPKDITGYYSGDEFFFSAFTPVSLEEHVKFIEEKKKEIKNVIQNLAKNIA